MPNVECPDWDRGTCKKHSGHKTPCSACIAEHNPKITVQRVESDEDALNLGLTFRDLLPGGRDAEWLITRM